MVLLLGLQQTTLLLQGEGALLKSSNRLETRVSWRAEQRNGADEQARSIGPAEVRPCHKCWSLILLFAETSLDRGTGRESSGQASIAATCGAETAYLLESRLAASR
jgi:hypothetical protein